VTHLTVQFLGYTPIPPLLRSLPLDQFSDFTKSADRLTKLSFTHLVGLLGKESLPSKVTETVYAHIPAEHKREAMDKLPF
jgi:hypothetical protein